MCDLYVHKLELSQFYESNISTRSQTFVKSYHSSKGISFFFYFFLFSLSFFLSSPEDIPSWPQEREEGKEERKGNTDVREKH